MRFPASFVNRGLAVAEASGGGRRKWPMIALIRFVLALTTYTVIAAFAFASAAILPGGDTLFQLKIETDKAVYSVGEPILVRVTLTNTSDQPYKLDSRPPWSVCVLQVFHTNGSPVLQDSVVGVQDLIPGWRFQPDQTRVAEYWDDKNVAAQWANIGRFGYGLKIPGTYTIVGKLVLRAYKESPHGADVVFLSGKSGPVTIRIVK
jgi:hypothetical protein